MNLPQTEITTEMEEGFIDLTFDLMKHTSDENGQTFVAQGLHNSQTLGFSFWLPPDWHKGKIGDHVTYQATISLSSIGSESDLFVAVLDKLYETDINPSAMLPTIKYKSLTLSGHPLHFEDGIVRMKLFFEHPEVNERYAELYLNVDLPAQKIYFQEKDQAYRAAVLASLITP